MEASSQLHDVAATPSAKGAPVNSEFDDGYYSCVEIYVALNTTL